MITLEQAKRRGIRPWVWYLAQVLPARAILLLITPVMYVRAITLAIAEMHSEFYAELKQAWKEAPGMFKDGE